MKRWNTRFFGEAQDFAEELKIRLSKRLVSASFLDEEGTLDEDVLRIKVDDHVCVDLSIFKNEICVSTKKRLSNQSLSTLKGVSFDSIVLNDNVDGGTPRANTYYLYEKKVHLAKNAKMHKRQIFMEACELIENICA